MISTLIGILILVAVAVLFGFLARRAWGSKRWLIKFPGVILAGLLTLVLALVAIVATIGFVRLYVPVGNPVASVKVAGTPEQIARGEKFAQFCAACHSSTRKPPLAGGKDNFAQIPNGPSFGKVYPPNLTPAGELKDWSDGEIIRAIREGVHKSGRPLLVMPTRGFRELSDDDVQAIVAYLRSMPATKHNADTDANTNEGNLLAALFSGAGILPYFAQPPITKPIASPPPGANLENGRYLARVIPCRECHGEDYGGRQPAAIGPPAGPNLTVLVQKWSEADYVKTIRTGVDPSGHSLDPDKMVWKEISAFATDDELKAIYMYLKSLPVVQTPAK